MATYIRAIVRWSARLTTILIAGICVPFFLGAPVGPLRTLHLRDSAGMVLLGATVIAMLLAWKWEFPASLASLLALGGFAVVARLNHYNLIAVGAIPNVLYLLDWALRNWRPYAGHQA